ncbi:RutC family protein [Penicillium subrubescens]|uniref:RutC family protein n=1 Tax=Penicillium subrubescens TaxID=1316194 RepID=A0A1Q5UD40_9EURO|nr:RutC family protein [Penicillium subrubescens]
MSIPKTAVKSPNAPAPPPFLSQAIVMGDYVFCSGQIGSNPETGALVQGSIQDRTRQIMSNLRAVLESAGTSLDNVVKCNIFLTSMSDFAAVTEVYTTFFSAPMPARTCVCVAALPMGTDVEIECIAGVRSSTSEKL